MVCNLCEKNEATIHFKGIIGTHMVKLNLCESCARQKGVDFSFEKNPFTVADMLAGLTSLEEISHVKKRERLRCPVCRSSYDDFKNTGKFGCAQCYQTFKNNIEPLLKRIHGSSRHTGKIYKGSPVQQTTGSFKISIEQLQEELMKAVKAENYEKAAELRDKIRLLEKREEIGTEVSATESLAGRRRHKGAKQ